MPEIFPLAVGKFFLFLLFWKVIFCQSNYFPAENEISKYKESEFKNGILIFLKNVLYWF